ncbi:MAG: DUF4340 domain-containing protein [Candidatus Hydrogenedentes bacterium]|nr:DUF4340 domain-containing protein [Candidatus Hydrogenedentota bacterium]
MKFRTTAILFGVLVLLCLGYWASLHWEQTAEREAVEAKRLYSFTGDALARLGVQQEDDPESVGERAEDGTWAIVAPHRIDAHQELWNRMADAFANLLNERTIEEEPGGLAGYELDQPRLRVHAVTRTGEEHRLAFGKLDPYQKDRYVQVDGGPVVLISDKSYFELNRTLDLLRQFFLFNDHKQGITRLEYARIRPREGGGTPGDADGPAELRGAEESAKVVVEWSEEEGAWRVIEPAPPGLADQEMVQQLVSEVQFAVGRGFVDEPESLDDYGLAPPKFRITANIGAEGAPQTAYFGVFARDDEKGGVFVKREGERAVFQVDAQVVVLLPPTPDAFREKRLLSREATEITRIDYTAGSTHTVLENDLDRGWRMVDPFQEPADQVAVSNLIGALRDLRGKGYYSGAWPSFGLEQPAIDIAVTFAGEDEPRHVRVGAVPQGSDRHYVTQDTGAVTTLSVQEIAWLANDLFYFRDKALLRFEAKQAGAASLTFRGAAYRFEMGTRKWEVMEPAGKVWDQQSDMAALLDALSEVEAAGIAEPAPPNQPDPYGLEQALLTFEVELAGDEAGTAGPLVIGAVSRENPRQRYATVPDRLEVFLVKQSLIDEVREALRGIRDR